MKLAVMLLVVAMSGTALGITGPAGTKVTFGNNWIKWKQTKKSFDRHNDFGEGGYVRHHQIKDGCLVHGPYVDLPKKGHVKAWIDVEALVGEEEYYKRISPIPQKAFGSDSALFTVELTANAGKKVLAKRTVRFKHMRKWRGKGWRYGRCTSANPCTSGGPRTKTRTFYVYTDNDSSDIVGKRLRSPYDKVELRVCDVNHHMTKVWIKSTTIELTY